MNHALSYKQLDRAASAIAGHQVWVTKQRELTMQDFIGRGHNVEKSLLLKAGKKSKK